MNEFDILVPENTLKPKPGMLLLASANMLDDTFGRSVIFLCECNHEGAFGLILNQPLAVNADDILENFENVTVPVFNGGPVQQNTLHILHRREDIDIGSKEIIPGVFWGGDFFELMQLIQGGIVKKSDVRLFLGYSGWSSGQLQQELDRDSWYVTHAKAAQVFRRDTINHWRSAFRTMPKPYHILENFPDNPHLN